MIVTAQASHSTPRTTYSVIDSTKLGSTSDLQPGSYTKIFSNAALHWILRNEATRKSVFEDASRLLQPGGRFCFEMGGMGNVAEMRTALLFTVSRRIGIGAAREADPWFFPDEAWMKGVLEATGFAVEKMELEYRPTTATSGGNQGKGGIEGWIRLMGKQFLDAVPEKERDACVKEVMEVLQTVSESPSGWIGFGYVRLRVLARKL